MKPENQTSEGLRRFIQSEPDMTAKVDNTAKPRWHLLDLLDPMQLGFVYESLIMNGTMENNMEASPCDALPYLQAAKAVASAIDANCGWENYILDYQAQCRKLADYGEESLEWVHEAELRQVRMRDAKNADGIAK